MASWRVPEVARGDWDRPSFTRESSVRQIAPGLLTSDRMSPTPEGHFPAGNLWNSNDYHHDYQSTSDGMHNGKTEYSAGGFDSDANGAKAERNTRGGAAARPAPATLGGVLDPNGGQSLGVNKNRREGRSRWRNKWFLIGLAALLVLIIVIVVPVAVIESRKNQAAAAPASAPSQSPTTPDGSQPSSPGAPASANGAIKGSGIGAAGTGDPSVVFFQHTNGDIWQTAARGNAQDFTGKVLSGGNIRNGTPIAAINYMASDRNTTHIAYMGKDNILRDSIQYNGTGTWQDGLLGAAKLQASTSARAGLTFVALRTGDKDATTYPLGSVNLYYGGGDGRIHEVSVSGGSSPGCANGPCIDINNPVWQEQFVFPEAMNGNADFYVAQPHDQSYLICSTVDNKLAWFHKQTYPADTSQWAAGAASNDAQLADNASVALAGDSLVFYQDASSEVKAIDFHPSPDPENPWGDTHDVAKGAANTRLVGTLLDGGGTPGVILQAANNSVTQYVQDGGGWKSYVVPVN